MGEWLVDRVESGIFNVPCHACEHHCTRRYYVLRHRSDDRIINVGADCAMKLAGTTTPTTLKPIDDATGDLPDWMC